ncbi:hypothetical protein GGI35DRAFT_277171 [Trichoderma velutinum]
MSYPKDFDLSADAAQNAPESNAEDKGHAFRKPFASVTDAVTNPYLLSLSPGWDGVKSGSGPSTEAGHSQSTTTTDASAANSGAHNELSEPTVKALRAGLASVDHTTGAADGRSVCSMGTSVDKTGESAYGTANAPFVDHEVSNMVTWTHDKISSLGKE